MCTIEIYRSRVKVYLPTTKRKSYCFLPIIYQEDLLLRSITGEVYLWISNRFLTINFNIDKLISSQVKEDVVQVLYLSEGQLWLYQAPTDIPRCRDYFLIEGLCDRDITTASSVKIKDIYHIAAVRERDVSYISITNPKPCEIDRAPVVTEIALDIQIPNQVTIASVAIGMHRPHSEQEAPRFGICIVTSSHWMYYYYYAEGETRLLFKRPDVLLVVNYNHKIVFLDTKGNISGVTGAYSHRTDWTCQYTIRNEQYYIKHRDREDRLCTLRNYISFQLQRSYQTVIPTTLAQIELYRRRRMKK